MLPDTRARIVGAEWKQEIKVSVETNVDLSTLEVQAVATTPAAEVMLPPMSPVDGQLMWPSPADAEKIDVYIVHGDHDLLDEQTLASRGETTSPRMQRALTEIAHADLISGESEQVEFKPFITIGDAKERELVKTIVAFANTIGGRLYIGVDDHRIVPQNGSELRKAFRGAEEEVWPRLDGRIRYLVREKIKPLPTIHIDRVEVMGDHLLMVRVEKSTNRPLATHENDIWIRKGATSRKADPQTEVPYFTDMDADTPLDDGTIDGSGTYRPSGL